MQSAGKEGLAQEGVNYQELREKFADQKKEEQDQEEGDLIQVSLSLPDGVSKELKVRNIVALPDKGPPLCLIRPELSNTLNVHCSSLRAVCSEEGVRQT